MMEKKSEKSEINKEKLEKKPVQENEQEHELLVRIIGTDIIGSKNVYTGLTSIKGVSWSISNTVCVKLNIPKQKKISDLTKEEIKKIEVFLKNPQIEDFLKNRRSDPQTGETNHFIGSDLDIKKEFDIKRLREIKSYKGIRHAAKLPVRGQRTRSHFRTRGIAMGIKKKK